MEYKSAISLYKRLRRLITLQSHLKSTNSPGLKKLQEIAKEIGVSQKTIYRDLTTLRVMQKELGGRLVIEEVK